MTYTLLHTTAFGTLMLKGSSLGLMQVSIHEASQANITLEELPVGHPLRQAVHQLDDYFRGERTKFELPLYWPEDTPPFYQKVWKLLLEIPYGHTTTYSALAHKLGNPKTLRAVGQANRYNPIAIIIPCHRVIAQNGHLQGYAYGLDIKRKLLALENPQSFAEQASLF